MLVDGPIAQMRGSSVGVVVAILTILISAMGCNAQQTTPPCESSTVSSTWGDATAIDVKAFLAKLKDAVRSENRAAVASLVEYPVDVIMPGKTIAKVKTRTEFVRKYDRIITQRVKQAVLSQDPDCVFANDQGIMLGDGEIWFAPGPAGQLKIFHIYAGW